MNNVKDRIEDMLSSLVTEVQDELRPKIEKLVIDVIELNQGFKPILEIRIPVWGEIKVRETEQFYENIKKVTKGKYLIFVLPLRNNRIPIRIRDEETADTCKDFLKDLMESNKAMTNKYYDTEFLVTDVGTVQIHTVLGIGIDKHKSLQSLLRKELDEHLRLLNKYKSQSS